MAIFPLPRPAPEERPRRCCPIRPGGSRLARLTSAAPLRSVRHVPAPGSALVADYTALGKRRTRVFGPEIAGTSAFSRSPASIRPTCRKTSRHTWVTLAGVRRAGPGSRAARRRDSRPCSVRFFSVRPSDDGCVEGSAGAIWRSPFRQNGWARPRDVAAVCAAFTACPSYCANCASDTRSSRRLRRTRAISTRTRP